MRLQLAPSVEGFTLAFRTCESAFCLAVCIPDHRSHLLLLWYQEAAVGPDIQEWRGDELVLRSGEPLRRRRGGVRIRGSVVGIWIWMMEEF
jgi:hypothetical protein